MKIQIYKDKKGEWRFRFKARNGRILCCSEESYKNKKTMIKTIERIAYNFSISDIVEI
ncbi:MAG: YegP family protein [Candidatus Helarchaeota archaeon]